MTERLKTGGIPVGNWIAKRTMENAAQLAIFSGDRTNPFRSGVIRLPILEKTISSQFKESESGVPIRTPHLVVDQLVHPTTGLPMRKGKIARIKIFKSQLVGQTEETSHINYYVIQEGEVFDLSKRTVLVSNPAEPDVSKVGHIERMLETGSPERTVRGETTRTASRMQDNPAFGEPDMPVHHAEGIDLKKLLIALNEVYVEDMPFNSAW